ncbi:MAG: discoidin domain-containing protein, partial [Saprospiraceae bacterium]
WLDNLLITNEAGDLWLEMTEQPVHNWAIAARAKANLLAIPFVSKGTRSFKDQQLIELQNLDPAATIYYQKLPETGTLSRPPDIQKYSSPIRVDASGRLAIWAEKGILKSGVDTFHYYLFNNFIQSVRYNTAYSPQYTAGGKEGLINGIHGGTDFRTGDWQGFEGKDLDVVLDLGKSQKVKHLSVRFLQDENAWIFFPTAVRVEVSEDGEHFQSAGTLPNDVSPLEKGLLQKDFMLDLPGRKARYVRVVGVSMGQCPPGHKGAGYPAWVFADEIELK